MFRYSEYTNFNCNANELTILFTGIYSHLLFGYSCDISLFNYNATK